MAFFKFSATNSGGRVVTGTLQATSEAQVRELLSQQGLKPEWIGNGPTAPAAQPAARPAPRAAAPAVNTQPRQQTAPRPQVEPAKIARPQTQPVPTAPATQTPAPDGPIPFSHTIKPKNAGFLFEQMASMVRAGVGVQQMLGTLSSQNRDPHVQRAMYAMSMNATEGRSLADAMARHPDVFNPDQVGTIRAGEMGGFLPDALQELATSSMHAHHLSRGFIWITFCTLFALFTTPGIVASIKGSLKSMELQDAAGGSLPTMTTLNNAISEQLRWSLPLSVALLVGTILLYKLWTSRFFRRARHQASLWVPLLSNRAKAEAAGRFAFSLSGITRAGVPPMTAYQIASQAIPNDVLRDNLLARIGHANEGSRLSDLVKGSGLLGYQYETMISNGELTGDVPGMLNNIARAEGVNTETANITAKKGINLALLLLFGVFIAVAGGILYRYFYDAIFRIVLKDT